MGIPQEANVPRGLEFLTRGRRDDFPDCVPGLHPLLDDAQSFPVRNAGTCG